jgi:hypothetical protein
LQGDLAHRVRGRTRRGAATAATAAAANHDNRSDDNDIAGEVNSYDDDAMSRCAASAARGRRTPSAVSVRTSQVLHRYEGPRVLRGPSAHRCALSVQSLP